MISVLIAFKSMPGQVREVQFKTEEDFWSDFRASQQQIEEDNSGEVIFALVPKCPQEDVPGGVPEEL